MDLTMKERIEQKLREQYKPSYLEIENESHRHATQPGAESHFRIVVVSSSFAGLSPLQRHRAVYELLSEEMKSIHALAVHTFTDTEWQASLKKETKSPPCLGGSKHDSKNRSE